MPAYVEYSPPTETEEFIISHFPSWFQSTRNMISTQTKKNLISGTRKHNKYATNISRPAHQRWHKRNEIEDCIPSGYKLKCCSICCLLWISLKFVLAIHSSRKLQHFTITWVIRLPPKQSGIIWRIRESDSSLNSSDRFAVLSGWDEHTFSPASN